MKCLLKGVLALALGFTCVNVSLAGEPEDSFLGDAVPLSALPQSVQLQELHRYFWAPVGTLGYHFSGLFLPRIFERYRLEGSLGFVSTTPFAGSHLLYSCLIYYPNVAPSSFTSIDANCEGRAPNTGHGNAGYVSSSQIPGTVPLSRCVIVGNGRLDHFDTLSTNCEGNRDARFDAVIGYVFL